MLRHAALCSYREREGWRTMRSHRLAPRVVITRAGAAVSALALAASHSAGRRCRLPLLRAVVAAAGLAVSASGLAAAPARRRWFRAVATCVSLSVAAIGLAALPAPPAQAAAIYPVNPGTDLTATADLPFPASDASSFSSQVMAPSLGLATSASRPRSLLPSTSGSRTSARPRRR